MVRAGILFLLLISGGKYSVFHHYVSCLLFFVCFIGASFKVEAITFISSLLSVFCLLVYFGFGKDVLNFIKFFFFFVYLNHVGFFNALFC